MRFFAFIFLFSFCLSSSLKAQQRVGNVNLDTIHIVLELRNTNEDNQDEINSILRSAAYTHQKPAENIKVSWALVPSFHIQRQEDGSFKSEISINSLAPIGDTKLYSFESTEYIFPAIKSFRVQVYKVDGSLVYVKEYNQKIISAKSEPRMFSFPFEHQRWTNGWSIEIDQLKLEYNTEEYSFEKWFQYTNDYQAANYLVDSLLEGYRYLQRSSHEPKSFLVKSIRQAKSMKHLCELPFYQATVLSKKDPDNLEKKVKIFQTFLDLNIQKYSDLVESSSFLDNEMVEELVETYLNEDEDLLNWQQK